MPIRLALYYQSVHSLPPTTTFFDPLLLLVLNGEHHEKTNRSVVAGVLKLFRPPASFTRQIFPLIPNLTQSVVETISPDLRIFLFHRFRVHRGSNSRFDRSVSVAKWTKCHTFER